MGVGVGLGFGGGSSRVCLPVLHSLKGLGLGGDHEGGRCGPRHVPGGVFGSNRGLRGFGGHHGGVGRRRLREAGGLSVLLEGCYGRRAGAGPALGAVVHHGLGGGGTRARAARTGRRQGVGLHQLGFGGLRVLPEVRTEKKRLQPTREIRRNLFPVRPLNCAQLHWRRWERQVCTFAANLQTHK